MLNPRRILGWALLAFSTLAALYALSAFLAGPSTSCADPLGCAVGESMNEGVGNALGTFALGLAVLAALVGLALLRPRHG